jgi:hypothetical protein
MRGRMERKVKRERTSIRSHSKKRKGCLQQPHSPLYKQNSNDNNCCLSTYSDVVVILGTKLGRAARDLSSNPKSRRSPDVRIYRLLCTEDTRDEFIFLMGGGGLGGEFVLAFSSLRVLLQSAVNTDSCIFGRRTQTRPQLLVLSNSRRECLRLKITQVSFLFPHLPLKAKTDITNRSYT